MNSADSKIYTGLDTTLISPKAFSRAINVYVPAAYKNGTAAPFLVIHDGPTQMLSTPPTSGALGNVRLALDNLTASSDPARRLPAFIAIAVANGGGDSLGSERGLEYDTMSDRFARFIDTEVLAAVLANAQIKAAYPNLVFTTDPEGRGSFGCSSGGAAALTMAWFRPDLFRKALTYSGTFVDQQDTDAPEERMYPLGAWEYHSSLALIANSDPKPLRVFVNANDRDNGYNARGERTPQLGDREPAHGRRAQSQGLSLPLRGRRERGPLRRQRSERHAGRRAGLALARLPDQLTRRLGAVSPKPRPSMSLTLSCRRPTGFRRER